MEKIILENDTSLYGLKNLENSLSLSFQENIKFDRICIRKQIQDIQSFTTNYIHQRSCQPYKEYPGKEEYSLSPYLYSSDALEVDLFTILKARRSVREFANSPIALSELALLLLYSYGVVQRFKNDETGGILGLRTLPSAGALYPLEVYLYIRDSSIPRGIYHFNIRKNTLECIDLGCKDEEFSKYLVLEPYINLKEVPCVIFITSFIERVLIKYGDRGYKFLMHEVGALTQNISLIGEALGLGSCLLGSFVDDNINSLLGADGVFETIQTAMVIGHKKKNNEGASTTSLEA